VHGMSFIPFQHSCEHHADQVSQVYSELFLDSPKDALPLLTSCRLVHKEFVHQIIRTENATLVYLECGRNLAAQFQSLKRFAARVIWVAEDFLTTVHKSPRAATTEAEPSARDNDDLGPSDSVVARREWLVASQGPYAMRLSIKYTEVPFVERLGVMMAIPSMAELERFLMWLAAFQCADLDLTERRGMAATKRVRIDFHENLIFQGGVSVHLREFDLFMTLIRHWWGLSDVKVYGEPMMANMVADRICRDRWDTLDEMRGTMMSLLDEIWFIASGPTTLEKKVKLINKLAAKVRYAQALLSWVRSTVQYTEWRRNYRGVAHSLTIFNKVLLELAREKTNPVICEGRRRSI